MEWNAAKHHVYPFSKEQKIKALKMNQNFLFPIKKKLTLLLQLSLYIISIFA